MTYSRGPGAKTDPAFASAVERAYLRGLDALVREAEATVDTVHPDLLATAIYAADPTNGGLRFKRLENADEIEARLRRALATHLDD